MKLVVLLLSLNGALAASCMGRSKAPLASPVGVSAANKNESPVYRANSQNELLTTPALGDIATLYEMFQHAATQYRDLEQFGQREEIDVRQKKVVVDGKEKTWEYYVNGAYAWMTYKDVSC
jgi:hypothetical protein